MSKKGYRITSSFSVQTDTLHHLLLPIIHLKGVGPELSKRFEQLNIHTLRDLIFHLPIGILSRKHVATLAQAYPGDTITAIVKVNAHKAPFKNKKLPYRVQCSDDWSALDLVFFHPSPAYLKSLLPIGATRLVSGKVAYFNKTLQITHPDHVAHPSALSDWIGVEPIYPLTHGITQNQIRKLILSALQKLGTLPEWLDSKDVRERGWPSFREALWSVHHPLREEDLSPLSPARERLAFDELLAQQLSLQVVRLQEGQERPAGDVQHSTLKEKALQLLPFTLTDDQISVLNEIEQDLNGRRRMTRLIQGDVGSGKTIVAFLALLLRIEAGYQGAFLAPTEILIRQHFHSLKPLAHQLGLSVALLTGRDKKSDRDRILSDLSNGTLHLIFGTHAIIQEDVRFKRLGLAIIDEQHRFGVKERLSLCEKGDHVDTLVMTATPIPRTLLLANFGDLACSYIRSKPKGRQEIDTRALPRLRLDAVIDGMGREIKKGGKIYWVCPLVEASDCLNLTSAEERFLSLKTHFGDTIGLIHGRMKTVEKDAVMADFVCGKIKILIATTVIEVGVDVRDATVMLIEHAERYGLSQLHQLRGRIGRGSCHAACILLYDAPLNPIAEARLRVMRETNDGFIIAEEDLRLRGGGEILGLRQSGAPDFHFASLDVHSTLLFQAHQTAEKWSKTHIQKGLKITPDWDRLLRLFDKIVVAKYLNAG